VSAHNFGSNAEQRVAQAIHAVTAPSVAWADVEWKTWSSFSAQASAALAVMHSHRHMLDREHIVTVPQSKFAALTRFLAHPNGSHSPVSDLTFEACGYGVLVRTFPWAAQRAYQEAFRSLEEVPEPEATDLDFGFAIESRVARALSGLPESDVDARKLFMVQARAAINAMNSTRHQLDRSHIIIFSQSKVADLTRFLTSPSATYSPVPDLIFEAEGTNVRVHTHPWTMNRDYAESLANGTRISNSAYKS
jgi:hypothetical protein